MTECYESEKNLPLIRWPSLKIHVIETEFKTGQPVQYLNKQYEPWTEPQLNRKST